ncbi:hypothetical protein EI42_01594 [Thermosporothrix hazakensis]|jgi:hypothetical protein|uniref:Uncharacterized protein n=1 Tax=Thermosporothrix hazakensis TaxID=644383 RepID=A0A326UE75_THEHA|nr:hypothetical protein [Thermosporothrix hazakensis]PZW33044.1 hypothetical protein EI42_01594 [Thermosporothrix hazakensis]GCE49076.1 hypothetical protein KTH_39450 [Thermosporothrix hazakensis]
MSNHIIGGDSRKSIFYKKRKNQPKALMANVGGNACSVALKEENEDFIEVIRVAIRENSGVLHAK